MTSRTLRFLVYNCSVAVLLSLGASFGAPSDNGSLPFPPDKPPAPGSLRNIPPPVPANLGQYVADTNAAIALGKALFWDQQAGSDGMACASCHFHAGADNRVKNALDPGLRNQLGGTISQTFNKTGTGGRGPNYTMKKADYPFHRLADPTDRQSAVLFDTDDITGSQGSFSSTITATTAVKGKGTSEADLILSSQCASIKNKDYVGPFNVNGTGVRQVEPRNTPSVINAVYNYRNFWDGRANNIFNGRNPFGLRDTAAGVDPANSILVVGPNGALVPEPVQIADASLASQAVGPALSNLEMTCAGAVFESLGHKMLGAIPLQTQTVDVTDSVLGTMAAKSGGLNTTYPTLIMRAFNGKYWNSNLKTSDGFTQMEKNFSLFWGLSIQMYESTLVSDNTPFDQFMSSSSGPGNPQALSYQAQQGMFVFQGTGGCIFCHKGAEFTGAATEQLITSNAQGSLLEHMIMGDGTPALYDSGFYNIGVRSPVEDIGVGGADPFGNPLSLTRMAKAMNPGLYTSRFFVPLDQFWVNACNFQVDACTGITNTFRDAVDGSFKVPSLRNVELTGPYFHNGSRSTLEQVLEFYNRGGDRTGPLNADSSGYGSNPTNLDPAIQPLNLSPTDIGNLVAFLKSLTDERVRWEQAPFDHPSLVIPNGEDGDENKVFKQPANGQARDTLLTVPAVGKAGRAAKGLGPILSFDAGLQ
jgi:cytochrome c peroxidase